MADKVNIEELIVSDMAKTYGEQIPHLLAHQLKNELDVYEFQPEDLNRIKYYVGDLYDKKILLYKSNLTNLKEPGTGTLHLLNYEYLLHANMSNKIKDGYAWPLLYILSVLPKIYKSKRFLYRIGDHHQKTTTKGMIAKTRVVSDRSVTLLKITPYRFWGNVNKVRNYDIPYNQKKDMIVWRGATTGNNKITPTRKSTLGKMRKLIKHTIRMTSNKEDVHLQDFLSKYFKDTIIWRRATTCKNKITPTRFDFVSKYSDESQIMNVGFSQIVQNKESYSDLVKGKMTLKEQLQYKFLVSLQGNDVASGLKWMLYSNSVVMMAKPTICSWAMEDQLKPFVHYLPLKDDFSNLEEVYQWAISNENACIEIANNATRFIEMFLDIRRELLIECEVMRRYLDNIEILD